jgi:nitroreductase
MRRKLFLTALAMMMLLPVVAQEKQSPSFDEVLTTRRSIRSYDATKTISEQEVRTLMEAVQEAPSWANQQPSKYYVAITPEKLAAVKELIGGNKRNVQDAPVLIVSTFERGKSGFFQGNPANEVGDGWGAYDNGLSNCYLILQARAMGFDTLIMGMRDADKLRSLFNIPENEAVMAVIALGYRKNQPVQPRHKQLDDVVKFY